MPMRNYFSVDRYVTPTRFSAARGIVLGMRLIRAAPAEMHELQRAALEVVRSDTLALQALLRERLRISKTDMDWLDTVLDSVWVGFRMALESKTKLLGRPAAKEAAEVLELVLPDDTNFVKSAYEVQWNESNTHLDNIAEQNLEERINALIGPDYLIAIREAHAAYTDGLGLGDTPLETTESVAISDSLRNLAISIAEYGRVSAGQLNRNDPASVEAFKKAMAPVDTHRAWLRSHSTSTETPPADENVVSIDGESPIDPVPPLPGS